MKKNGSNSRNISAILTIFRFCPWYMLALLLLGLCTGLLAALNTEYTGKLVDTTIEYAGSGETWPIFRVLLIVLSFALVNWAASYLAGIIRSRIDEALNLKITEETLRISNRVDYLCYISKEHRDAQGAYADAGLSVDISIGMYGIIGLVQVVVSFISYTILIYGIIGNTALIASLLVAVVSTLVGIRSNHIRTKLREDTTEPRRKLTYIDSLHRDAASYSEMTLFGFEARLRSLFSEAFKAYSSKRYRSERKVAAYNISAALVEAAIALCALLSFFALGKITSAGQMTIVFTSFFSMVGYARFVGGGAAMSKALFTRVNLFNKYRATYELPLVTGKAPIRVPRAPAVELCGVAFAYDQNKKILDGITLSIQPGETVAIVGENGAGKTTLANIILGLFQCEGIVRTFGRDPYHARRYGIADSVAVLQNFGHYQALTLGENIGFGDEIDPKKLERIDDFFIGRDYITMMGEKFGGVSYSGGEWQKIALARCASSNATIMILDEPTAALDPMAEASVFRRFMEVNRGKTCILITHRLGAVRGADLILVLKDRHIIERGTHEELMRSAGYYAAMFNAQAQWYTQESKA